MQLIEELIIVDKASRIPVYLQLSQAIILGIWQGKLRKGLRLPGARRIADLLKINRLTVVAAFEELESQGWLEMLPRKGAFVKLNLPMLSPRKLGDGGTIFRLPEKPGVCV